MNKFDFTSTDPDLLLAEVKKTGWGYFEVQPNLRTREMAIFAWEVVSYLLARMDADESPTAYVPEVEWKQFIELLLDGNFNIYIMLTENQRPWQDVVNAINAYVNIAPGPLTSASLPVFE